MVTFEMATAMETRILIRFFTLDRDASVSGPNEPEQWKRLWW